MAESEEGISVASLAELARHFDIRKFTEEFNKHTGVTSALTLAAGLDTWLEHTIQARMRPLSSTVERRMFGGYGPLSTFAARIDVAFAIEILSEETYTDLTIIKDIRNKLAHATQFMDFGNPPISEICTRFKGWTKDGDNVDLYKDRAIIVFEELKASLTRDIRVRLLKEAAAKT